MKTRRTMATTAVLAALCLPAAALAQQDTARRDTTRAGREQPQRDTSRNRMDEQGRRNAQDQGRVRAESRGAVETGARSRRNLGLTSTQVTMLQQALRDDGCDPGPIDGIVGPRTRRAIACGFQENDLDGRNLNELFRSLDLQLTVQDSLGVDAIMQGNANARARTGRETDANRDRARDRDTGASRDTTTNPERPRQRDGGRADSVHRDAARDTSQTTERPPRR